MLVRDAPRGPRKIDTTEPSTQGAEIESSPLPASTAVPLRDPSVNTPIIDMGDLDNGTTDKSGKQPTKPRVKRAPSAGPPPTTPAASTAKSGDIAGPIKVWK